MRTLSISIVKNLKRYNETMKPHKQRENNIIIHDGWEWHFCSNIKNIEELNHVCAILGINYELHTQGDNIEHYTTDTNYKSEYFWHLENLPKGAKKIKALSNGSLVDCYYINENHTLTFYRPNPNNKDIYKPLEIGDHVNYSKNNPIF